MIRVGLFSSVAVLLLGGVSLGADLSTQGVVSVPAPAGFEGGYVGASVGYSWGMAALSSPAAPGTTLTTDPAGFLAGVQAGYDFHVSDRIVLGLEGNIDWTNQQATISVSGGPPFTYNTNFEGSFRGRLGYDVGDTMPYLEAGAAVANGNLSTAGFGGSGVTYTGWTVGAGIEHMLTQNISANVEYRYSDYGTQSLVGAGLGAGGINSHFTDSSARLGINYHF